MGATQSSLPSEPKLDSTSAGAETNGTLEEKTDATKISYHEDKSKEKELSGMDLINFKCRKRNKAYQKCVSKWYSEQFLTGKSMHQEEVCGDKFEAYRLCVLKGIKKEIWDKQSLPPPKEGSLLAEVMDDEEEAQ